MNIIKRLFNIILPPTVEKIECRQGKIFKVTYKGSKEVKAVPYSVRNFLF